MKPQTQRDMMKMLPQEALTAAAEQLQQQNQALEAELYIRSAPRVAELMTALGGLINAAERGNGQAKQALQNFFATLDKAKQVGGGIIVPPVKFQAPLGEDGRPLE